MNTFVLPVANVALVGRHFEGLTPQGEEQQEFG
jgi:hypothetical protein